MEILAKTSAAILPAFMIIGLGWFLRRVGLLSENLVSGMNKFSFIVLLPILLFQKIGLHPIEEAFNGPLIIGSLISCGAVWLAMFGLVKLKGNIAPDRTGVMVQGSFRPNTAVVGLAILAGAYGDSVFGPGGVLLGVHVPFINILSVLALLLPHRTTRGLEGFSTMFAALVSNPLIIGAFLGALRSATGFGLPVFVDTAFDMLTAMAIPLALICVGGSLRFDKLRIDMAASLATTAMKLVFMPALAWAILGGLFHLDGMMLAIGVIYASAPTASSSFIMAHQMEGDSDLAASILVTTYLFSIFTMSAWLAALFRWG